MNEPLYKMIARRNKLIDNCRTHGDKSRSAVNEISYLNRQISIRENDDIKRPVQ